VNHDRAQAASTPLPRDADRLDVADERTGHVEDEKSGDSLSLGANVGDIDLFDRIGHYAQRGLVVAP
jgi:hypothetical protein